MEDVDSISVAVAGIDIDTVEALENRTMVGFINKFICDTASFLNNFAGECERRLQKVQEKIIRIDANLRILEAKLASIPPLVTGAVMPSQHPSTSTTSTSASDLRSSEPQMTPMVDDTETPSSSSSAPTNETDSNISDAEKDSSEKRNVDDDDDETSGASNSHSKDDPIYAKYFKMVAVGVPIPAVKLKMSSEGLDPSVLDMK